MSAEDFLQRALDMVENMTPEELADFLGLGSMTDKQVQTQEKYEEDKLSGLNDHLD